MKRRKDEIGKVWEIKDVGGNEYFLGMQVQQDLKQGTIQFMQCPYWEHVLNRFSLENITPRNTPLPVGIILDNNMCPKTDSEWKQMEDHIVMLQCTIRYEPLNGHTVSHDMGSANSLSQ